MNIEISIREAKSSEDAVIAQHFYQLWIDIGVKENNIRDDWESVTVDYINFARKDLFHKSFFAEVDNKIVGSVSCQLFAGLYPHVLEKTERNDGYIWGVFVDKRYRRQGIGKQLTYTAVQYLKAIGCLRAILNASPEGRFVYESMGFVNSNAMHLDLNSYC